MANTRVRLIQLIGELVMLHGDNISNVIRFSHYFTYYRFNLQLNFKWLCHTKFVRSFS